MVQELTYGFTFGINKISCLVVREGGVKDIYLYHLVLGLVVV